MNLFGWFKRSKMKREIIINVEKLETRVAVMENGKRLFRGSCTGTCSRTCRGTCRGTCCRSRRRSCRRYKTKSVRNGKGNVRFRC